MFQLSIITKSQKNLESIEKNNIFYDNIEGEVKLFRIPSENISLTDKFETFRFLPISRTNLIFIIAIPENFTYENVINYFGKEIEKIKGILFINSQYKFTSLIIHFNNQDSADNFYYQFKTKNYPENKSEFLYCVFISKIEYNKNEEHNLKITEIPTCPLCIEKVEPSSIGIETMLNIFPCNRWLNYKKNCKVCSKFPSISLLKCEKCKNSNSTSLWCCLICGFIGCNRYEEKHAILHYNETNHRYSIELNTQRIWDYMTDKWVHRIISTKENSTILLEDINHVDESPSTQEFLQRMENVIDEYNKVLSTQLELQRKYYDDEVKKMEEKYFNNNEVCSIKLNSILEDIKKKKYKIKLNQKLYKDCLKKLVEQDKQISKIKDDIELNKNLISNLKEDKEKEKRGEVKNKIVEEKELIINKQKEKIEFLQNELEKYYSELK